MGFLELSRNDIWAGNTSAGEKKRVDRAEAGARSAPGRVWSLLDYAHGLNYRLCSPPDSVTTIIATFLR
jgi:hypothetical protein